MSRLTNWSHKALLNMATLVEYASRSGHKLARKNSVVTILGILRS